MEDGPGLRRWQQGRSYGVGLVALGGGLWEGGLAGGALKRQETLWRGRIGRGSWLAGRLDFDAVAAQSFGAVEGFVGVAGEGLKGQIVRGLKRGDADAEGYGVDRRRKLAGTKGGGAKLLGQGGCRFRRDIEEEEGELVSAEPGAMAAWDAGCCFLERLGKRDQHLVAMLMTVVVVGLLELVDVHQQEG